MDIRDYELTDEQAVVSLWKACNLVVPWNDPHKDILRKLDVAPGLFLVGVESDEIIASVMGGYEGHRGSINYLAVSPEHQRLGFGKQMMNAIEARLRELGCPKINLMVRQNNLDVIRCYEALGYKAESVVVLGKRLEDDA